MVKIIFKYFIAFIIELLLDLSESCSPINSVIIRQLTRSFSTTPVKLIHFATQRRIGLLIIQPGTKWCGAGDIADNYNDLGKERETDMCCREHDYCPDTIVAGETKYNLTNEVFYTRLSCKCDETFRKCLRKANTTAGNNIGVVYFNALSTKCFRVDFPVLKCVRRGGWLNIKCLEYAYNTTAVKKYQWFDVPNY